MGNDIAYKIASIGSVRIKMFDRIVKILSNIQHISNLKKILISLGTLDSLGFRYTGEGGVIRVSKGSMVVTKGDKTNGLYFLQGSTMIGIVAVSISDGLDSDITRLWHMCLGYMSEKGMYILSKQGLLCDQKLNLTFVSIVFGKQYIVQFTIGVHKTKSTVDYIHSTFLCLSYVPLKGGA